MSEDLHALELEFAKDPKSAIFIPLCEAYLGQKRFMEAMVVCKKGIKNLPADDPRGRLLLAKIYATQGKAPKAEQEFTKILDAFPNNPLVLAGRATYLNNAGRTDEAAAAIQQAMALGPGIPEVVAVAQAMGMQMAAPAPQQPGMMPQQPMGQPMQQPGMVPQQPMGQPMQQPGMVPQQPMGQPMQQPGMAPQQPMGQPMQQPGMAPQQPMGQPMQQPGMAPQQPGMPMQQPGMAPQQPMAGNPFAPQQPAGGSPFGGASPFEDAPKLEHVDDFFAKDALGFSDDAIPDGMTAGPGRLTIIGFVPKTGGSIKVTLAIMGAVMLAFGAWIAYYYLSAQQQKDIAKIYGQVKTYMEQDSYLGYSNAVDESKRILALDDSSNEALSVMAYASAVLAVDHGEKDKLKDAEGYLKRAKDASDDEFSYRIAAQGLIDYGKGAPKKCFEYLDAMVKKGAANDLIDMERFRCQRAIGADEKAIRKSLAFLSQSVGIARVYNFLGYYHYDHGDINKADSNFGQATNSFRNHIGAILGGAFAKLYHDFDLTEGAVKDVKKVRALAQDGSPRDKTMLEFAEGMLHLKLMQADKAEENFKKVNLKLVDAPFFYERGRIYMQQRNYEQAIKDFSRALSQSPTRASYLAGLASAQVRGRKYDEANKSLAKLKAIDAESVYIPLLTGRMLYMQNKLKEARAALEKVPVKDAEKHVEARLLAAKTLLRERKKDLALKYIEKLLTNMPPGSQPPLQAQVLVDYGRVYEAMRQKDAALETYLNARDTFRMYAPVHYFICRAEKGDAGKGSCKTYLRLQPWGEYRKDAAKRAGCKLDDLKACFAAR